jgi:actin-related protein 6
MNNERITVPEILFNPSDIGIYQAGIPETIVQSVTALHPDMHATMYSNIVLMGGCTMFKGFKERLETELRALVPAEYPINITLPAEYVTNTIELIV